jgi:photosystem II stability/assembly factor-like uncharacterized protein
MLNRTALLFAALALFASCDDDPQTTPQTWSEAFDTEATGAFLCAWGTGDDQIWIVGGQPDAREIFEYDGQEWRELTVPVGPLLNWVHGAAQTVWFVGNEGHALRRRSGEVELTETGVTAPLWGVWAADSDEAWAVGGDPIASGPADPVLLHWKDGAWTRIALPETDRSFRALFKVWGTSASNVYAVGSRGIILHYNGTTWRQELSGTARDLISLWGTGPDDILVAGGRANGILVRWDGDTWTDRVLEGEPGMNGVWMAPDGRATVVGVQGRILSVAPKSFDYTRDNTSNRTLLHGVWGAPNGHRVAVGGTFDSNPPWRGVVVELQP